MSRTSTLSACPGTQGGVLGPSESDLGVGHKCQNLRIDLTVAVADRQEVNGAVSRACRGVPPALHALLFLWGAADGPRVTRRCRPTDQRGRAANPWGSAALGPPPDHACDESLPGAGRPGPAVDRASPRGTRPPVGATLPREPTRTCASGIAAAMARAVHPYPSRTRRSSGCRRGCMRPPAPRPPPRPARASQSTDRAAPCPGRCPHRAHHGFDRHYGFLPGATDQFNPGLTYDNHHVDPPRRPEEGYHITEDLVDRAIGFLRDKQSHRPRQPFFLYFALGAGTTLWGRIPRS